MRILEDVIYPCLSEMEPDVARLEPTAPLLGPDAPFDSVAFVSFIVAVEDRVREVTGVSIVLASPDALSRSRSPFRSLSSLAEYVEELLAAQESRVA